MRKLLPFLTGLMIGLGGPVMAQTGGDHVPSGGSHAPTGIMVDHAFTGKVIDSLGLALSRYYVFPDIAAQWTRYLKQRWRDGAYDATAQPGELARRLQEDMQRVHRDGHFMLLYQPGAHLSPPSKGTNPASAVARSAPAERAKGLEAERRENFWFKRVEVLPGNVGYIVLNGFTPFPREADTTLMSALRFVAHTRAIILDFRANTGGTPDMLARVATHFFAARTHLLDLSDRMTGDSSLFTDPSASEGLILTMPLYILTSNLTFSGGEGLAYTLQSLQRAVIVGETTGGGAHRVAPFPVGMGYIAGIPFGRATSPYTHTDWEGVGVHPDIPVPADSALNAAAAAIFGNDAWALDELTGRYSRQTPDTNTLKTYEGQYGPLTFFRKGTSFYCRLADMGGIVLRVYAIRPGTFTLNDDAHVRFQEGRAVIRWRNGAEDVFDKITTPHREK